MHFKVNTHMHIILKDCLSQVYVKKSNPLSVLPVFKHQNQNLDIPIIVFLIHLFVSFETTIIKENLLKNSFESHKI